ncbi:uncharacterized protein MELLADRAFT_117635 [Melampsora larici-populina 98AG31]|uniref:Uncharacterized protein n=1 Tax=Melampsora larici-populina (strain 98AG31 / pathotype 3-4-7) TaxID=747676 RepID=F4RZU7_MELLP|nr:uncharacterized protein MELLADRAFT_117635 [Melampsora larici-populina 98AG31]EGG02064.1 hypothetical protein MELLADRAFT_117635 [Melampsora larici-populina 98AG31]
MAQVEQYLTDHLHSSKERLLDDPSHPLNSAVPSRPGPELDIKYHGLPEPPHYISPQSHENHDSIETQDNSVATRSLEEDRPTASDHVSEPIKSSDIEKVPDQDVATKETIPHSTSEVEKVADHDEPEEATSHVISEAEKVPDHEDTEEIGPHSTSEVVKDSVPAPIFEDTAMPEKSKPVHVNEASEEPSMEPAPTQEVVDHPTTSEEPAPVEEAVEAEESKSVPEPVAVEEVSPVEEPSTITESEPLTNGISHEEETPKEESEVVRSEPNGIVSQPSVNHKQPTTQTESNVSTHDWTDLTRPEVQFALCLFAVPWTSLLITSRTLNQICYMIFDWQLVQPVTGLLLSVLAPSMLYTSLIAVFISLLSQSSTDP